MRPTKQFFIKLVKTSLMIIGAFFLTSCSGNTYEDEYLNNRLQENLNRTDSSSNSIQNSWAYCNQVLGAGFQGNLEVYRNKSGALHTDAIRIGLSVLPSSYQDSTTSIKFFQWQADSTNSQLDETPLSFYLEDQSSGAPISGSMTALLASDITTFAQQAFGSSMNNSNFFSRINIVVTGIARSADAMKLALYKNTILEAETNFLIPTFAANPNTYAIDHPQVLVNLHPHTQQQSLSDQQYADLNRSLCLY